GRADRLRNRPSGWDRAARAGVCQLGHVPRLRGARGPVRRGRASPREGGRPDVSSVDAASPRPRTLRLVRPDEQRVVVRARVDARARRTIALLLGSTAFLVGTGIVMVLSASSVSAFSEYGDSFVFVQRQAAYAVVGILACYLTSRMRYDAWK